MSKKKKNESNKEENVQETIDQLKAKLDSKIEEVNEYKDKYLRTLAEMDNQRKRVMKEKEVLQKYANEKLILSILPVVDNFERAISAGEDSESVEKIVDGIRLIFKQLVNILEREGLQSFESIGKKFDPYKHEALLTIESEEHKPSTIVDEIEKGYLLSDKVIRPAKVTVSKQGIKKEDDVNGG